jgi:hypothetical protein
VGFVGGVLANVLFGFWQGFAIGVKSRSFSKEYLLPCFTLGLGPSSSPKLWKVPQFSAAEFESSVRSECQAFTIPWPEFSTLADLFRFREVSYTPVFPAPIAPSERPVSLSCLALYRFVLSSISLTYLQLNIAICPSSPSQAPLQAHRPPSESIRPSVNPPYLVVLPPQTMCLARFIIARASSIVRVRDLSWCPLLAVGFHLLSHSYASTPPLTWCWALTGWMRVWPL